MDEMKNGTDLIVRDVDEQGNTIEDIDWTVWRRDRVEEITDENGEVIEIISHCSHIPQVEIDEKEHEAAIQNLKETDYIAAKFAERIMTCESLEEIQEVAAKYKERYGTVLQFRQKWRGEVNVIRAKYGQKGE